VLSWMRSDPVELNNLEARSHQRLIREFIALHLTDGRPLKAFAAWEQSSLFTGRSQLT
jgi:hypothetical protein